MPITTELPVLDLLTMVEDGPQRHGAQIMALMDDTVSYQFHVPTAETVTGPQAVFDELLRQTDHYSDLHFEIKTVSATAPRVVVERYDSFVWPANGARVGYPVAAVFDLTPDGRIAAWREYWDRGELMSQVDAASR
ncbi:limonene-1,2-epoxide hydrolase family protein [Mycobacterium sp. MUNTM1]